MSDKERFEQHLYQCENCAFSERSDLCTIGRELLYEAADELPDSWQRELERILRKEQIEKEADAQAAYYADSGEEI